MAGYYDDEFDNDAAAENQRRALEAFAKQQHNLDPEDFDVSRFVGIRPEDTERQQEFYREAKAAATRKNGADGGADEHYRAAFQEMKGPAPAPENTPMQRPSRAGKILGVRDSTEHYNEAAKTLGRGRKGKRASEE